MTRYHALSAVLFVALATTAPAQDRITGANYPLAQKFNKDFVAQHVQESSVAPQWIGKTDVFWYAARTPTGTRYWKVDPAKKEKAPLFDHVALAAALSEAVEEAARPRHAPHSTARVVAADGKKLTFVFGEHALRVRPRREQAQAARQGLRRRHGAALPGSRSSACAGELGDERVNEMLRRFRDRTRTRTRRRTTRRRTT